MRPSDWQAVLSESLVSRGDIRHGTTSCKQRSLLSQIRI